MRKHIIILLAAFSTFIITCSTPDNPYKNPDNASINDVRLPSVTTLDAHSTYACSMQVVLPQFVDTLRAVLRQSGRIDTLLLYDTIPVDSPWVAFTFTPQSAGACTLDIELIRSNGSTDLSRHIFTIQDLSPIVESDSSSIKAYLGGTVTVRFQAHDPDKNLRMCYVEIATTDTILIDTIYNFGFNTDSAEIVRTYSGSTLFDGLQNPFLIYCQAIDDDSLISIRAVCSVFVADTIKPSVTLLPPFRIDSAITKIQLPCTVSVVATDNWGIDSIHFDSLDMAFDSGSDTARISVSSLDSELHTYTITAWDKAGNTANLHVPIVYAGKRTYPPHINELSPTVREGVKFDTLRLDTCATVGNPFVTDSQYIHDSLDWTIIDSAGATIKTILHGAPLSFYKFYVIHPSDTEWAGAIPYMFKVTTPGNLQDVKLVTFTVTEVPDTPMIKIWGQCVPASTAFDTMFLDTCAFDADDKANTLQWSFKNGNYLMVDSITQFMTLGKQAAGSIIELPPIGRTVFTRRIAIVIKPHMIVPATFTDSLQFTVWDAGKLTRTKMIYFTRGLCVKF